MAHVHQHQRPIDKEFEDADDTGVLTLTGRNLRTFPVVAQDLVDYLEIVEADFSKNRFDRLPKEVVSFKSLVKITCHHNNLRYIPAEMSTLPELRTVDLSRNFIQTVPVEICRMRLKSLNLSNNRLLSIPVEFGKLTHLQYLNLSCNSLQELPPSFAELSALQYCDLHRNELKDLPEDLYQLTELQFLDVSSNQITRLPPSLRNLTSIQALRVMDNPLESPPSQLCLRGLVHMFKYLEELDKRGSDSSLASSRDSSMNRRRTKQRPLSTRPVSESTPVKNGGQVGLLDDFTTLVNKTFGDGEGTPTGGNMHWSVAQFMTEDKPPSPLLDQSRDEYREASQRLYKHQEKNKSKVQRSASPPVSGIKEEVLVAGGSNTLPKRKNEAPLEDGVKGRMLPGETQPRSGSWNSHTRNAKAVLPNKYSATPPAERARSANVSDEEKARRNSPAHRPQSLAAESPKRASKLGGLEVTSGGGQGHSSGAGGHRPESDREGSITPTNETPPIIDSGPTTPTKKAPHDAAPVISMVIQELEGSPTVKKRRLPPAEAPPIVPPPTELVVEADWTMATSPRKKKEKDVFKFLKESDTNYTIRRQQLQMNLVLEKNQHVKKAVEGVLGVELADDVGEWVSDGVLLCELVNKLHPGTITTINTPPVGQKISRIKQTINISAFIDACKKLKVPEEELCSAGDIIDVRDPIRVITCLQRVLDSAGN
ncbi:leucine-rich repeat and calponin homology domain-containing protein 2-like isoform X2 [Halichondria panicea]|uniref:leucine-rich repeat and calponin homology domain-containing protein 2-like isoform X2 n=1 Tax=Halichondria panicea TaxID=6063 RepID=UPI00312BB6D7